MNPTSITLMTAPDSRVLVVGGTELADARRFVDLVDVDAARVQFKATGVQVRVEYSVDLGATWATLVAEDTYVGGNPYVSCWQAVDPAAKANDVLVRAMGVGNGLIVSVVFVELQYR